MTANRGKRGSPPRTFSAAEARALVLTSQGFATPRLARRATRRDVRALVDALGVVQLDSVNVLVRSHYLPAWSRLGAYDREHLDALVQRTPRAAFEYWGHEASILPIALHPLMRWRMARAEHHAWGHVRRIARDQPSFIRDVLALVGERGPISAGEIELGDRARAGWWEWSEAKRAIEWLFWTGQVTTAHRRGFERIYDLPERVLPAAVLAAATPSEADAQRALVERSARALGIATEADLRDYYRLPLAVTRAAIAELVEAGTLERVAVEGWAKPGYIHRAARARAIDRDRAALVSPFDSLVWARERTHRLFGMHYRLEIYTPAPKRVHGYYVLPFLLGDQLVARVDLKADRAAKTLRVQAAHAEGRPTPRVAAALSRELVALGEWLGLPHVEVARRGDLSALLRRTRR